MKTISIFFTIFNLSLFLFISCGDSPHDKLIGEWELAEEGVKLIFSEEGILTVNAGGMNEKKLNYKLIEAGEQIKLQIFENNELANEGIVTFLDDGIVEVTSINKENNMTLLSGSQVEKKQREKREQAEREARTAEERARQAAIDLKKSIIDNYLIIEEWNWNTEPMSREERESLVNQIPGRNYTHIMYASLTIRNASEYAIKDFKLQFSIDAKSGTHIQDIDSETIYEKIGAYERKTIRNIEIGKVKIGEGKANVKIIDCIVIN